MKPPPTEVIVTYGEGNSVGKEMLRRYLISRYCACCRCRYEVKTPDNPHWECEDCRNDPNARQAFA